MNNDNNIHAIRTDFTNLNDYDIYKFLLLTKKIIELQTEYKFKLIDLRNNSQYESCFINFPSCVEPSMKNGDIISKIYKTYELFEKILKLINIKKNVKLSSIFKKYLNANEYKIFEKFTKIVAIINLIKYKLETKSLNEIKNYYLFEKLNQYIPNITTILNLSCLENICYAKQFDQNKKCDYYNYNYQNIDILFIMKTIDDETYEKIYETLYLFK